MRQPSSPAEPAQGATQANSYNNGPQLLSHVEMALLLIAPIGIWHGLIGRICAFLLLAIALIHRDDNQLSRRAWGQLGGYLCIMVGLSIFSPQPIEAAKAALIFASGFAMVIPGLAIGRCLKRGQASLISLLPVTILALVYLRSPATFEGRFFFGLRGNPNGTGYSVLFTLIILGIAYQAFAQRFERKDQQFKLAVAANGVAYGGYLLLSNHRTGWLAAILFFTTWASGKHRSTRYAHTLIYLAGIATLVALLVLLDRKDLYSSIISQSNRLSLWWTAILETIQTHPLVGHGFRSFRDVIGIHSHQGYSRAFNHPHNIYVELFFSTGLIGFAATGWYVQSLWRAAGQANIDFNAPITRACAAGIAALMVAFFFGKELASVEVVGSLSCLAGILWAQKDIA